MEIYKFLLLKINPPDMEGLFFEIVISKVLAPTYSRTLKEHYHRHDGA